MGRVDADKLLQDVGRRIAEIREEQELTQEALATALGFQTSRYVQRVEAGTQNVTLRALADIASALQTSVPALLEKPRPHQPRRGRPPKRRSGRST